MNILDYNEPKTIKEAIEILDDIFSQSSQEETDYFNNSTTSDIMYKYHHSVGQKIRNAWLWPKQYKVAGKPSEYTYEYSDLAKLFIDLKIAHPDDISGFLLKLFWLFKHDKAKTLDQHIDFLINEHIIKNIIE